MLLTEGNWEDAKQVWQEEAREEGMKLGSAKGRGEGMKELILHLLAVMPKEQAAQTLQMPVEEKIAKS